MLTRPAQQTVQFHLEMHQRSCHPKNSGLLNPLQMLSDLIELRKKHIALPLRGAQSRNQFPLFFLQASHCEIKSLDLTLQLKLLHVTLPNLLLKIKHIMV